MTATSLSEPYDDSDDIGSIDAHMDLVPCEVVDAVCLWIKRRYFPRYRRSGWVFHFAVAYPEQYCTKDLEMYVRDTPQARRSSKLFHVVSIATNGQVQDGQKIKASMFLHKMFRCKTRQVPAFDGKPAYTVIDDFIEKLTG